jgi:phage terminase large subunit
MSYSIAELTPTSRAGYAPRGAAAAVWRSHAPEVVISGPAETGKTYSTLHKLDACMWKYPGAQAALVRKTRKSMTGSVLSSYENKVLGKGSPVVPYGGKSPEWYDYPNGSRVYVGGMDNPDKVLSSERDLILVNQAEELTIDDWEKLTTRATGRAGNMPYAQVIGDCNPGPPTHWIKQRARLQLLESRHEDNPVLFDAAGIITAQGRRTLSVLDNLTGVRYRRLRLGQWAASEGAVYEDWDTAINLVDRFPIPDAWRRIRVIDFGYTNPFVCQWWAIDGDGRMYLYRELYMSQRTVATHLPLINRLSAGEQIEVTISDHDAEDRATLREGTTNPDGTAVPGIATIAADKAVSRGIQKVQDRLKKAGDGKPRLVVLRDSLVEADPVLLEQRKPVCTAQEFDSYVWQKAADGRATKEEPVKLNDHGMDTLRYGVMYIDAGMNPAGMISTVELDTYDEEVDLWDSLIS